MSESAYPKKIKCAFQDWSPQIHYAQFQRMNACKLEVRRLYDFEILYVVRGELQTNIYEQTYTISPGQLIFLPSGVFHQNTIALQNTKLLGIHFDFFGELDIQKEEDMVVNEQQFYELKFASEPYSDQYPLLSSQVVYTPPSSCVYLMEQLAEEFSNRQLGYELVCRGLILNILVHLQRSLRSRESANVSMHGASLFKIMEQIESSPENDWTSQWIADQLNLSIDYTAKLFKQFAGMPPSEFVQSIRHREARKLLRETNLPIERIGERVGYPDIHYFSRIFRKLEGITASEYRKLSRVL